MIKGTIYCIKNTINNKCYVGQTIQEPYRRKHKHINRPDKSSLIDKAIQKYGKENFEWKYLEENIDNQRNLNLMEKFWIVHLESKSHQWGYNIKDGGANGRHSESTKEKISKNRIGRFKGKDNPYYRVIPSLDIRKKVSKGYIGGYYNKTINPEKKCWQSRIKFRGRQQSLGYFHDPISAHIVYKLVLNEIIKVGE